jgi:ribosomal protein L37AE/L43A
MCYRVLGVGTPVQLYCKICGELAKINYDTGIWRCVNKNCKNVKVTDSSRIKNRLTDFEWRDCIEEKE